MSEAANVLSQQPGARKVLRLDSLTGLRWWAAFGVFAYHFQNVGHFRGSGLAAIGYTGVAFFFVLSGFVLTWSARPTTTVRQFWVRRFARIWPAHFVALLLAIPVFYSFDPNPDHTWVKPLQWGPLIASVFLVQGYWNSNIFLFGGNPAAWTLSCEAFFYAIHPAVNKVFQKLRTVMLPLMMILALAVGYAMRTYWNTPAPFLRSWEFVLGMLAALLLKRGVRLRVPMPVVYVGLVALVAGYWLLERTNFAPNVTALLSGSWMLLLPIIYMVVIMIAASADLDGRPSMMRHWLMVRGGEWSYCFYLVHATVLYAYRGIFEVRVGVLGFVALFLVCLASAAALYYLVERPFEKRIRAWGDRKFACVPPA